jgi:hypothetical protein
MKAYQPIVLNTLTPYAGPQGFGMNKMTGQTIDQQTTVAVNQIDPTPFRGYSVPMSALAYYGLSEEMEMRPKGQTGRPTIPGGQANTTTTRPPVIDPRAQQQQAARMQTTAPIILTPMITAPAVVDPVVPAVVEPVVFTPAPAAKPWYKSPLYLALLAAGVFMVAKKYKIV